MADNMPPVPALDPEALGKELLTELCKKPQLFNAPKARGLLYQGADPNASYLNGNNALIIAAENGHQEIIKSLTEKGALIDRKNIRGETALICAATQGHTTLAQELIRHGAALEAADICGDTPLICAAQNGHAVLVQVLIDLGANIDAQNYNGVTAVIHAAGRQHRNVVQILEKAAKEQAEAALAAEKQKRRKFLDKTDCNRGLRQDTPARQPFKFGPGHRP